MIGSHAVRVVGGEWVTCREGGWGEVGPMPGGWLRESKSHAGRVLGGRVGPLVAQHQAHLLRLPSLGMLSIVGGCCLVAGWSGRLARPVWRENVTFSQKLAFGLEKLTFDFV